MLTLFFIKYIILINHICYKYEINIYIAFMKSLNFLA